jgi:superfamily II RNA helicase
VSPDGLLASLGTNPTDDTLLVAFLEWAANQGLELYPAQEEAVLELFANNNVILKTPTGSGKSLVAFAGHVATIARKGRSWYTAPIKALVSEKFFELSGELGSENVGMITGDGSVNASAPVICCTAEILANKALREGKDADVSLVVMDEFHYYSDPQRGTAWQVPLLELVQAQFLLMSATLGDTDSFESELTERTGRPTTVVSSTDRPVPLHFEFRETPIQESI